MQQQLTVGLYVPEMLVTGFYRLDGRLFLFPIRGSGDFWANFSECRGGAGGGGVLEGGDGGGGGGMVMVMGLSWRWYRVRHNPLLRVTGPV